MTTLEQSTATAHCCKPRTTCVSRCCFCTCICIILQAKLSSLGRLEDRLNIKLSVAAELPGQMEGLARQQRAEAASMEGLRSEVRLLQAQLGKLERGQALANSEAAVACLNPAQLSHVSRHRVLAAAIVVSNSCDSYDSRNH
jgi:hypothetical protein